MMTKIATILALVVFAATQAYSIPIPGIYDTGVDDSGNPLAIGTPDPHYSLIFEDTELTARAIDQHPAWYDVSDLPGQWINSSSEEEASGYTFLPAGTYSYQLTFDLSGFDTSTASITGQWLTDNTGSLMLNGTLTGDVIPESGNRGFSAFETQIFTLNSGFLPGENTLTFLVFNEPRNPNNPDNPTGLFVDLSSDATPAQVAPIPEPSTVILLGIGTLGVWAVSRRRKS